LLLLCCVLVCGSRTAAQSTRELPDVVVTGQVSVDVIPPLIQMGPAEIPSYGVGTLLELLAEVRPQTRSSRSASNPIVLINGRLAGPTEFNNVPVEGIEKLEILPEVEALRYGFGQDQLVVKVTLKDHFKAATAYLADAAGTDGGGQDRYTDGSLVQLDTQMQGSIRGSYRNDSSIRENQRDIDLPDSRYRTLLPGLSDATLGANLAGALLGISTSIEGSFELKRTDALQGLAVAADSAAPLLEQGASTGTAHLAAHAMGHLGRFSWITTATYNRTEDRSLTGTGVDVGGDLLSERTDARYASESIDFSLTGAPFVLPAGPAYFNAKLAVSAQQFDTDTELPMVPTERIDLSRVDRSLTINANIPLTSRERNVLAPFGDLSTNLNLGVDDVSAFGTLATYGFGFAWSPVRKVALTLAFADTRLAPTVQQLSSPPVETPNLETFDYVTGETVYVTSIGGGERNLSATDDRNARLAVSLGPFFTGARLIAEYERGRIRDAIGQLPPLTSAVEAAFPDRFVRDAEGNLITVDNRWVNLALERKDDLRWGFTMPLLKPKGDGGAGNQPPVARLSIFDTWYLRDTTLVKSGLPLLDQLDGAPSDVTGGQPRHKVEVRAGGFDKGWGAWMYATYQTATKVVDASTLDGLSFSALTKVNLRLFADVRQALKIDAPWADRLRVSFAVNNMFDERQRVRDPSGATPIGFQPGYLDPLGRVLQLTARKQF
jgi:iron complex outermembrane receptor protein